MALVEKQLGKRVAGLRQLAGLTQAALAERVEVATETISRLERGSAVPSLGRLERIAEALGVPLADLLRLKEQPSRRDHELDRLLALLRRRSAEEVALIADVAERIFSATRK
jgi:transcriptional regulator with XRE-family HTH domain